MPEFSYAKPTIFQQHFRYPVVMVVVIGVAVAIISVAVAAVAMFLALLPLPCSLLLLSSFVSLLLLRVGNCCSRIVMVQVVLQDAGYEFHRAKRFLFSVFGFRLSTSQRLKYLFVGNGL